MTSKKASKQAANQAAATLLVELRTEEMPPLLLDGAAAALATNLVQDLTSNRLCEADVSYQYWFTPRRIAVHVEEVAQRSAALDGMRRGPAVRLAYGPGKRPTPALTGFLRSAGAAAKDLKEITHKGETYVAIERGGGGRTLRDLLGPALQHAVAKTVAPRLMRLDGSQDRFLRPIRSVYAVHGAKALRLPHVFGEKSLDHTLGHHFLHEEEVRIKNAASYIQDMKQRKVIVDAEERAAKIRKQAKVLARDVIIDASLLHEAANMCEYPTCYLVEFDKDFLKLPLKVIETCMGKHLRSFAVGKKKLRNKFIFVADNKPRDDKKLRKGLERVMHARLEDTKFIYDLDCEVRSEKLLERIDAINYVHGMGSMLGRSKRIKHLVSEYAQPLNLQQNEIEHAKGAGEYLKADLGLKLVDEYPELEGHIGGALLDRPAPVKQLIGGHLDRSLDNQPNPPRDALVLALEIERLITISAIDGLPKGSRDPRGLRRAMSRVIRILHRHADADLDLLIRLAWEQCEKAAKEHGAIKSPGFSSQSEQTIVALKCFAIERVAHIASDLLGRAIDKRTLNAIIDPMLRNNESSSKLQVADALMRIDALETFAQKQRDELDRLLGTAKRLSKIAGDHQGGAVDAKLLREAAERELYKAYEERVVEVKQLVEEDKYLECCGRLASLAPFVDDFFDNVMVNVDDEIVRTNRLNLVCQAHDLMNELIDTRKLYS